MRLKKVLLIKLRSLGDTVILTAAINALHKQNPHLEIQVVATKPWSSLLRGLPGLTQIWEYERRTETAARARTLARLAWRLRLEHFDAVFNLHASPSSATLAYATGAPVRAIHFHGLNHKNRFSTLTIAGKGEVKPAIERDADTLRAAGFKLPEGNLPVVILEEAEKKEARQYLNSLGLGPSPLIIAPGASRPTKIWSPHNFSKLVQMWQREHQVPVGILVGPGEEIIAQEMIDACATFELTPKIVTGLGIRKVAAVISHAAVLVGNDSGPRHLAVATSTPTVTLMGPEHPFEWHPYPLQNHPFHFIENLPCRTNNNPQALPWCSLSTCTQEQHRCMTLITPENVYSSIKKVARLS